MSLILLVRAKCIRNLSQNPKSILFLTVIIRNNKSTIFCFQTEAYQILTPFQITWHDYIVQLLYNKVFSWTKLHINTSRKKRVIKGIYQRCRRRLIKPQPGSEIGGRMQKVIINNELNNDGTLSAVYARNGGAATLNKCLYLHHRPLFLPHADGIIIEKVLAV